jgi:Domain of unknown function (DUF222)/HNH endonuclease
MCTTGQQPSSVGEALDAVRAGLAYLNQIDAAGLPGPVQAGCLRHLAQAESAYTEAHARMLAAFNTGAVHEDDGQGSARTWLRWQTQITTGAATGAVGWMRRLAAHPALAQALADGSVSPSWARAIAAWTDQLPEDHRAAADGILLDAAAGGAGLADLAGLAGEMRARTATPDEDPDPDGGFADRRLRLGITFGGAGHLDGDLTPACAAALAAVLDALGKKAGPEDVRTPVQRQHDALEEACRRLAGTGCLPDGAGQPTQIQLHLTLDQLRNLPGGRDAEIAWRAGQATGDGQPGWLAGRAATGYACDAALTPAVTGHLDRAALDALTSEYLGRHTPACPVHCHFGHSTHPGSRPSPGSGDAGSGQADSTEPGGTGTEPGSGAGRAGCRCASRPLPIATMARLRDTLLRQAADVLSGPGGLAAFLRTQLLGAQFPAVSLPLETGAATAQVPGHLRRAVITRDRHCAFPGCAQSPPACQVHHLQPRAQGGPTRLDNLLLLCAFHHLIAVHQWGWTLTLHGDGTVTARSPDHKRTLHGHSPPTRTT